MGKRLFDVVVASLGLVALCPLFVLISVWVKLESPGPVFFRQARVGRGGKIFYIHKFRTMVADAEQKGAQLSVDGDARVTRSGALLRRFRLDELPQLVDVVVGNMSLVGPRPEVPRYMAYYPEDVRRRVLSVRPGTTDRASIEFRDEGRMLAASSRPEATYVEEILPRKWQYYQEYVRGRTFWGDVGLILRTLAAVFGRHGGGKGHGRRD